MDPTAPNNNNPKDPKEPQSPIQPGQFVSVGADEGVFKQPPVTPMQTQPLENPIQAAPSFPPSQQPEPQMAQNVPQMPEQFPPQQPNPTPFAPPLSTSQPEQSGPPSTISRMRIILIIVGFIVLIALIGVAVWLFILPRMQNNQSNKITTEETPIEAPSPPPPRTTGGFSDLPSATEEASESTDSAQ